MKKIVPPLFSSLADGGLPVARLALKMTESEPTPCQSPPSPTWAAPRRRAGLPDLPCLGGSEGSLPNRSTAIDGKSPGRWALSSPCAARGVLAVVVRGCSKHLATPCRLVQVGRGCPNDLANSVGQVARSSRIARKRLPRHQLIASTIWPRMWPLGQIVARGGFGPARKRAGSRQGLLPGAPADPYLPN